jgi:hypothetical protein
MSFTAWLLSTIAVGALAGWLLRMEMARWGMLTVIACLLGSAFSNYLFGLVDRWSGELAPAQPEFSLARLLAMLAATLTILGVINLLRIGRLR